MLAEYKKKTNQAIGLAIVAFLMAILINSLSKSQIATAMAYVFMTSVMPLWICGVWFYAKGKGYHGAWGLLGVFTLFGLIILAFFPDRHKFIRENQQIENKSKSEQLRSNR
jgi:hypothetical protein